MYSTCDGLGLSLKSGWSDGTVGDTDASQLSKAGFRTPADVDNQISIVGMCDVSAQPTASAVSVTFLILHRCGDLITVDVTSKLSIDKAIIAIREPVEGVKGHISCLETSPRNGTSKLVKWNIVE
jgi:hypothetical protein